MDNASGIRPLRDLILVRAETEVETNRGVIIIPKSAGEKERMAQIYGVVIAMGPTCYAFEKGQYGIDVGVKPGMRVQFAKYQGLVVKGKDGIEYRMLRDDDLMAEVDVEVKKDVET